MFWHGVHFPVSLAWNLRLGRRGGVIKQIKAMASVIHIYHSLPAERKRKNEGEREREREREREGPPET